MNPDYGSGGDPYEVASSCVHMPECWYKALLMGPSLSTSHKWRWMVFKYGPNVLESRTRIGGIHQGDEIGYGFAASREEVLTLCQDAADEDYYGEDMAWWAHALRGSVETESDETG